MITIATRLPGQYPYDLPFDLAATEDVTIEWSAGKHGAITAEARAMVRSMLLLDPASRPSAASLTDGAWITFQTWLTENDYVEC